MGLHLDLSKVFDKNTKIQGPNVVRKAGLLINMGDNPTKQQVMRKREANKREFGLPLSFVTNLKLPKA